MNLSFGKIYHLNMSNTDARLVMIKNNGNLENPDVWLFFQDVSTFIPRSMRLENAEKLIVEAGEVKATDFEIVKAKLPADKSISEADTKADIKADSEADSKKILIEEAETKAEAEQDMTSSNDVSQELQEVYDNYEQMSFFAMIDED